MLRLVSILSLLLIASGADLADVARDAPRADGAPVALQARTFGIDEVVVRERPFYSNLTKADTAGPRPRRCIAISGGGLRSAAFSLGVLRGLAAQGILEQVDVVTAVSGGSWSIAWLLSEAVALKRPVEEILADKGEYEILANNFEFISEMDVGGKLLTSWVNVLDPLMKGLRSKADTEPFTTSEQYAAQIVDAFVRSDLPMSPKLANASRNANMPYPIFVATAVVETSEGLKYTADVGLPATKKIFELAPLHMGSPYHTYSDFPMRLTLAETAAISSSALDELHEEELELPELLRLYSGIVNLRTSYRYNDHDYRELFPNSNNLDDLAYEDHESVRALKQLISLPNLRLYMADGGFSENLGILPLLARTCEGVLSVDASYDPLLGYAELSNTLSIITEEMGHAVDIDEVDGETRRIDVRDIQGRPLSEIVLIKLSDAPCRRRDRSGSSAGVMAATAAWFCDRLRELPDFPHLPVGKFSYSDLEFRGLVYLGEAEVCRQLPLIGDAFALPGRPICREPPNLYDIALSEYGRDPAAEDLSAKVYSRVRAQRPGDPALERRVRQIGLRIADVVPAPDVDWEFAVLRSDRPGAFALPGGKIGVDEGVLAIAEGDAEIAAVLSHMMAHSLAGHTYQPTVFGRELGDPSGYRMQRYLEDRKRQERAQLEQMSARIGELGRVFGLWGQAPEIAAPEDGLLYAATMAGNVSYSPRQEIEADQLGLTYMAKAGYDPRAAVHLWQKIGQHEETDLGAFTDDHRGATARGQSLTDLLPAAVALYEATLTR